MINLVVFILCAGEQSRFPAGMLKQSLAVDGEPLIERTVKQVRALYQAEPWVVVRSGQPFGLEMRYFYPSDYKYVFDTLQSTSGQWGHTNIILLGDVYYTNSALMTIKSAPHFAYGTKGEIYAVKFQRGEIVKLSRAISTARQNAQATGKGKLWNVYRAWDGIPQTNEVLGPSFYHLPEGDETQDFDRMESYQNFCLNHKATA